MGGVVRILTFLCAILLGGVPHYGIVTEIDDELIAVEDSTGNVWEFYGTGWRTGDSITIVISADKQVKGAY